MKVIEITSEDKFLSSIRELLVEAPQERFLSTQSAAEYFDVHPNTISNMVNEGRLKRYVNGRIVRFKLSDLQKAFQPE